MLLGLLLTILLIGAIGFWSGKKVSDAKSFATGGGKANKWIVCGTIMGTLVSGQSTIGTAQLAFHFGLSAWWFTIGAAMGCVVLALFYAKPLRHSNSTTLMEVIRKEYGVRTELISSMLCLIGIFISIIAQIIASSALITSLLPVPYLLAALMAVGLMLFYVVFGGIWGAGFGGVVKMVLLYIASLTAGIFVWRTTHGFAGLIDQIGATLASVPNTDTPSPSSSQYSSFFARGPLKDIGSCISLVLGVVATQTYAQGVWSAKNDNEGIRGTLLCAFLIPPIGAACTLVGMYMRAHYITADELASMEQLGMTIPDGISVIESSVQAFPTFIADHLPPFFGGITLGTLFVTIVGGGAGLALGCATIVFRDIITPLRRRFCSPKSESSSNAKHDLFVLRTIILIFLIIATAVSFLSIGTYINDLGFLSLGLRATAVLIPLSCALFIPGRIKPPFALASMVAGTLMLLAAKIIQLPADPVYWGLGIGAIVCLCGIKHR